MRNRTDNDYRSTPDLHVKGVPNEQVGFYSFPTATNYYNYNEGPRTIRKSSISDVLTPKGVLRVPNPCVHTKHSAAGFCGANVVFTFDSPTPTANVRWDGSFMHDRVPVIPTYPASALMDDLCSLIQGNFDTKLSLPIALIEGAQTLSMLKNPFNLLKPNYRTRVRKLTAASLLSKGANIWLEQLFGWQQFKSDVDESSKALATFLNSPATKQFEDQDSRLSVSQKQVITDVGEEYSVGTTSSTWSAYTTKLNWDNDTHGFFRLANVHREVKYTLGCHQKMGMLNRIRHTKSILQLTGSEVTWNNIRDTVWNLLPFSFVIDWFIDTRGIWYLPNFLRLSSTDVKNLCYSTKFSCLYDVDWMPAPRILSSMNIWPWYGKIPNGQSVQYVRTVVPGQSYVYTRSLGLPVIDSVVTSTLALRGLTWSKLTTGAALFAQRFAKNR
jgi:hypothetical protein